MTLDLATVSQIISQKISELEKQKRDLEIRLNEQTETMKGNWNPHEPAFRKWFPTGGRGG